MAKHAFIVPSIPGHCITPFELELLKGWGFMPIGEATDFLRMGAHCFHLEQTLAIPGHAWDPEHPLAERIPHEPGPKGSVVLHLGDALLRVEEVLQVILQRCPSIEAFIIEGAKTHSIMEPGAFGGFVSWITREAIRTMDTERMLDMLAQPPKKNRVVVLYDEDMTPRVIADRPDEIDLALVSLEDEDIMGTPILVDGYLRNALIDKPEVLSVGAGEVCIHRIYEPLFRPGTDGEEGSKKSFHKDAQRNARIRQQHQDVLAMIRRRRQNFA